MRRLINREPQRGTALFLFGLPFLLTLLAYMVASQARLAVNPDDKLLPDFATIGQAIVRMAFTADRPIDPDRFQKWMGNLLQTRGQDIFRCKGILDVQGAPRRYVFQGVHMLMDTDWGNPWQDGEKRSSKLVFIGRDLDREALRAGFESCLV